MSQTFSQAGTSATGSSYDPVVIATDDYGDIRLALGFDASDDTNVPSSLIEGRAFLRSAETDITRMVSNYATIVDADDDDYDAQRADTLKEAVIEATASRLAMLWFAQRTGSEVTSEGVGPLRVTFRAGPEWAKLARDLARGAVELVYRTIYWGAASPAVSLSTVAGPTRNLTNTAIGVRDIEAALWPPVTYGSGGPL